MIDVRWREASVRDRPLELLDKEHQLLVRIASKPTRVFTRAELPRSVWGFETLGCTRTLDSHASRLRCKLCADSGEKLVVNLWGGGYCLYRDEVVRSEAA